MAHALDLRDEAVVQQRIRAHGRHVYSRVACECHAQGRYRIRHDAELRRCKHSFTIALKRWKAAPFRFLESLSPRTLRLTNACRERHSTRRRWEERKPTHRNADTAPKRSVSAMATPLA